jgi:hypothetical protein
MDIDYCPKCGSMNTSMDLSTRKISCNSCGYGGKPEFTDQLSIHKGKLIPPTANDDELGKIGKSKTKEDLDTIFNMIGKNPVSKVLPD